MASVTLTLKGTAEADARKAGDRHLRMFTREAGLLRFPLIPLSIATTDAHDVWDTVDRPGRKPLLYRSGRNLEKQSFSVDLWDHGRSVEPYKRQLRRLSRSKDPVVVTFADDERGIFRITGLAFTDTDENTSGRPTKSTVDLELTEDSQAAVVVGPVVRGRGKNMARRA